VVPVDYDSSVWQYHLFIFGQLAYKHQAHVEASCASALCKHVMQQFKQLYSRILCDLLVASIYKDFEL
jgi:hypothetical protein